MLCIATFFSATIITEMFASHNTITMVKSLIVMPGLFILIPAIAVTGASGFALGKGRKGCIVDAKKKRMPFIGANGVFILIPAAIALNHWASLNMFDTKFYVVQVLELIAGAANLIFMGINFRDGLLLSGKRRNKNSS